ncbi:MAG: IgA Peptidase M64 [candidate division KSB1 bacterium]|nr:IgA Peptidase M64 [candidate division KSB1 bacterium]MDZ7301029.1 IgA Peptidase M64 [candidate division KSB1 bacterium]MDZ7310293.1 IgA Peptidase M64 [candidate division KSB1 bacterium]
MKWFIVLVMVAQIASAQPTDSFDSFFTDQILRIDYFHSGTATEEKIAIDQVYAGGEWAESRTRLIDDLNLGNYLLRVSDAATNRMIFSRGYATLFNEWQTTEEAKRGVFKTMHETVCMPLPKKPVIVEILRRDRQNYFSQQLFTTVIDPGSRFVSHEKRATPAEVFPLIKNGEPANKVDLALLAEGYTANQRQKFISDAQRMTDIFFEHTPFKENKPKFNVSAVFVASTEAGPDNPRGGEWRNTALGMSFNTFDTDRYMMSFENRAIQDAAANVPFDYIIILVNSTKYGGGGIFRFYACTTVDNERSEYVLVHEFGHAFTQLADEYFSSEVAYLDAYPSGVEPWEPNITRLLNPPEVKWRQFVEKDTPIPTPWDQAGYLKLEEERGKALQAAKTEAERQNVRQKYARLLDEFFAKQQYWNKVGAFEGAGYLAKGLYRPTLRSIMISGTRDFGPVSTAAIQRMIDFHAK